MAAISLRGYWRTLIVFIACNPAMRMTKLTTIASTGRLMNRSVKDFILNVRQSGAERSAFKVPLRDPSTFARDDDAAIASLCVHHHESTGVGFTWGLGARSLLITTGRPLRNLITPVLTTSSIDF